MADMMKAIRIVAPGHVEIVDVPVPVPEHDEVLVEVKAVTACTQWDLTLLAGVDIFEREDYPKYPQEPGVPGHEMAGEVIAVGHGVHTYSIGDRVAAWSSRASQQPGRYGYYAEYAAVPTDCLLHIPDHMSYTDAAPLELAMCVAASIRQAGDLAGVHVAVGGAGPAGLAALQMARALGARSITVFDPVDSRRELALSLGADEAYAPESPDSQHLNSCDVEIAFECSGRAASAENLLRITNDRVYLFGVVHGDIRYSIEHWSKNVSLHGYPGHTLESAELALGLMSSCAVKFDGIVSTPYSFDSYQDGMNLVKSGEISKLCIIP